MISILYPCHCTEKSSVLFPSMPDSLKQASCSPLYRRSPCGFVSPRGRWSLRSRDETFPSTSINTHTRGRPYHPHHHAHTSPTKELLISDSLGAFTHQSYSHQYHLRVFIGLLPLSSGVSLCDCARVRLPLNT